MYISYGQLCTEVYDLSKPLGYSAGDVEFYMQRLSGLQGRALEVGCGSGRVLIPLLQAGIQVDGLDNSTAMLDSCQSRCKQLQLNPVLIEDEMHSFTLNERYEAIIIPGASFQLIEGRERAIAALKNFHTHLATGGKLIIDLFIPTDYNESFASTRSWETADHEVLILEEKRIEVDILQQKIVSLLKYEKWKDGALVQTELQRFPISWYGHYEFQLLLEAAGYGELIQTADYKVGQAAQKAGQMITYEATKL